MSIERKKDKKGRTYYVNTENGKRASANSYASENAEKITNGQIKYSELTKNQKLAYKAKTRIRYKNKFVKKEIGEKVRKTHNKTINEKKQKGELLPTERKIKKGEDLSNFIDDETFKKIASIDESKYLQNNKIKSTSSDIFNIQAELTERFKKGENVSVKDSDGKTYHGLDAIEKISNYEQTKKEGDPDSNVIFLHRLDTSFDENTLERSVFISLKNTTEIIS